MSSNKVIIKAEIDTASVFEKELEESLRGIVRSKARKWFEDDIAEMVDELIDKRMRNWTSGSYSSPSTLSKLVGERIDAVINKQVDMIEVSEDMIKERLEEKLGFIDGVIQNITESKVNSYNIQNYIRDRVEQRIEQTLTHDIVSAVLLRLDGIKYDDIRKIEASQKE